MGTTIASLTLGTACNEVNFREFDGDHEIPTDIAREGLQWIKI